VLAVGAEVGELQTGVGREGDGRFHAQKQRISHNAASGRLAKSTAKPFPVEVSRAARRC
jgi:hypothetical protein